MRRTVADLKEREAWSRAVIADDLSPNTKLIGWRLALYLNFRTGRCNPSYQTLAREVRITERSAIRAVRALEDAGWLVVERSGGGPYSKTNNFKLTMRMTGVTAASSLSGAAGVTAASNRGDSRRQKRVTAVSPEQRKEQRREQRRGTFNCKRQTPLYHQKIEESFAQFWTVFPKRVGKDAARKIFAAAIGRGIAPDALIEGARRYAAARSGEDQKFTKHPAGWLRDGCWQDEPSADGVTIDNATGQVIARRKPQHRTWDDVIAMFKEDRE